MKVVFLSNFLNHHQLPFCQEMYKRFKNDFKFVQTEPVHEERLNMGYAEMADQFPFLLCPYKSEEEKVKTQKLVDKADFVITGSAPEFYIENRLKNNQPIFRFSERFLRHQLWRYLTPKSLKFMYHRHIKNKNKNVFVLCASIYTAHDFARYGVYKNKTYKWGYFPEFIEYDIDKLMEKKKGDKVRLLWVARFLPLKHPERFLKCCKRLKDEGIPFSADIVGSGECESEMRDYIAANGLDNDIALLGNMKPVEVRNLMEKANIFMFNSDYREGWGAVINEAMNSGCAVVTSHAPGAPGFLIQHGKSGLIYKDNSFNNLYRCLKSAVTNSTYCEDLGRNAYQAIKDTWNAKTAAENLIHVMEALKDGKTPSIAYGPGSPAQPIHQRKIYRMLKKGRVI